MASFYAGSIVTKSAAQSQEKIRDDKGRFVPVPPFSIPTPKSSFGVIGDFAFRVNDVYPGSPAEQLGIQPGDMITKIDREQFYSVSDWMELLAEKNPGDDVEVHYTRFGDSCIREQRKVKSVMAALKR
jgi:hypothetical protein